MANYHMASVRNPNTPLDSEKLVFSVDLVHFVMATRWEEYASRPRNTNGCESYRQEIYNAFTGDIKKAVEAYTERFRESVENRFVEYIQNNNEVAASSFTNYAREYEREYFLEGVFNLRNLLKYFVSVALAAGHYYSKGVKDAPDIASNLIFLKLPREYFENSEYWDRLDAAASDILGNNNEERIEEPVNLNLIEYQEH